MRSSPNAPNTSRHQRPGSHRFTLGLVKTGINGLKGKRVEDECALKRSVVMQVVLTWETAYTADRGAA